MFTFRLQTAQFEAQLWKFIQAMGVTAQQATQQQAKLATRDLARITAPRNQAQGEIAVSESITNAATLIPASPEASAWSKRWALLAARRDYNTMTALLQALPKYRGYRVAPFDGEVLHLSKRNYRGRVDTVQRVVVSEADAYRAHVEKIKARVGWAKAGWNAAARYFRLKLDPWVDRHGIRGGQIVTSRANDPVSPMIEIHSSTIKMPAYERIINYVLAKRARDMEKQMRYALEKWAGDANTRRVSESAAGLDVQQYTVTPVETEEVIL